MCRILFLGILCLATSTALAQDVTTVAGGAQAHKVLLENGHVRVFDVVLAPGQKIAMHSHPAYMMYWITDAKIKTTLPDGTTSVVDARAGTANWHDAVTHAVENVGTAQAHFVQVEMK